MREFYHKDVDLQKEVLKGENDLEGLDIIRIFGKKNLEDIQRKISKATGFAFITVNYRGEPLTEPESFTSFCRKVRTNPHALACCKSSDAFGAIQAASTQKPSICFCPCGLMDIAIPIIVKGQFLGGFIGGQIRCNQAPSEVGRLENVIKHEMVYREMDGYKELFNQIPAYSYDKVVDVANLVSLIINQLTENEIERKFQINIFQDKICELTEKVKNYAVENNLMASEMARLVTQLNPYFLINTVNSIANLAIIDEAERTYEMLFHFSEYLKRILTNNKSSVYLSDELENIEQYLKMQKIKFCDTLAYTISIPRNIKMQKVPSHIIMPFIENAIFYGIATRSDGGMINITISYENDDVVIVIEDNGGGKTEDELAEIYGNYKGGFEGDGIDLGMKDARKRLKSLFGKEYDVVIKNIPNLGRICTIKYPKHYEERVNNV